MFQFQFFHYFILSVPYKKWAICWLTHSCAAAYSSKYCTDLRTHGKFKWQRQSFSSSCRLGPISGQIVLFDPALPLQPDVCHRAAVEFPHRKYLALGTFTAEMTAAEAEELPVLCAENDAASAETNQGDGEEKETGPETDEQPCSVETKMEADEEKPATEAYKATVEVVTDAGSAADETAVLQEPGPRPDTLESPAEVSDELAAKETKQDSGEDSRSSGLDCEKSKSSGEDGEKPGGGGGELGDKRRPSVEMSSSDGEPLSRMDSEDRYAGEMAG